jgi:7-cyano-7-deazaguanine reductase
MSKVIENNATPHSDCNSPLHSLNKTPLGEKSTLSRHYDPSVLVPIPRSMLRTTLAIAAALPFQGYDYLRAYEISWLNQNNHPQAAIANIKIPCDSIALIESKSLKLYLNSFNQSPFRNIAEVQQRMQQDLSQHSQSEVTVTLEPCHRANIAPLNRIPSAINLDHLDIDCTPNAKQFLLQHPKNSSKKEMLYTHLFRSLCPVTEQPDWATIYIAYQGIALQHEALMQYLLAFRQCKSFHEHCIEKIYCHILQQCKPEKLAVLGLFTRRGGVEINPYRSNDPDILPMDSIPRDPRQ